MKLISYDFDSPVEVIQKYSAWGWKYFFTDLYEHMVYGYKRYRNGELAMQKLVNNYDFQTILDIGCGNGLASKYFTDAGKDVTACDYGRSLILKTPWPRKL